jgi:hypothetical protein
LANQVAKVEAILLLFKFNQPLKDYADLLHPLSTLKLAYSQHLHRFSRRLFQSNALKWENMHTDKADPGFFIHSCTNQLSEKHGLP